MTMDDDLTPVEQQILRFERQWWKYAGAKEEAIRDLFGCSSTAYYQRLARLVDRPAELAFYPVPVRRLQRVRGRGQQLRLAN